MSTNVATNFPPQTYSSQFFLNTITEDVGAAQTSSKKRGKNSDVAESSNAVIDCFISTMSVLYDLRHTLIILLALQTSQCTNITKYDCIDAHIPTIRTYNSITELQHNSIEYKSENYVAFNASTIRQLQKNDFISYDSNLIRKLFLNNKRIEQISRGTFNHLFCVKYLLLQDNLIDTLEDGTFEGLYSIEELNLKNNNIKNIQMEAFSNLVHLLKLDLSFNQISYLSDKAFDHLKNLWELNLEHNHITDLRWGLFTSTPHLSKLYLGANNLSHLEPANLNQLTNLDVLDISYNGIQEVPSNLFNHLEKLRDLKLFGNQLTDLEINAPALKRIHIEDNEWQCDRLKQIVKELFVKGIGIVWDEVTYTENVNVYDLGCQDANTSSVSTTTRIPWWKSTTAKPITTTSTTTSTITSTETSISDDHYMSVKDKDSIISAIYDLKVVIILLIFVVIIFNITHILLKMNICDRFRRSYNNSGQYQFSGMSGSSLPLLNR